MFVILLRFVIVTSQYSPWFVLIPELSLSETLLQAECSHLIDQNWGWDDDPGQLAIVYTPCTILSPYCLLIWFFLSGSSKQTEWPMGTCSSDNLNYPQPMHLPTTDGFGNQEYFLISRWIHKDKTRSNYVQNYLISVLLISNFQEGGYCIYCLCCHSINVSLVELDRQVFSIDRRSKRMERYIGIIEAFLGWGCSSVGMGVSV